jgi:hypothetical protein
MESSNFSFDYEKNEYTWNGEGYTDILVYFKDVYNAYAAFETSLWVDSCVENLARSAFFSKTEDEFLSSAMAIAICELMLDSECQSMAIDLYCYYLVSDYDSVANVVGDYFDEVARRERVSVLS